jgi:hypothetical protein
MRTYALSPLTLPSQPSSPAKGTYSPDSPTKRVKIPVFNFQDPPKPKRSWFCCCCRKEKDLSSYIPTDSPHSKEKDLGTLSFDGYGAIILKPKYPQTPVTGNPNKDSEAQL